MKKTMGASPLIREFINNISINTPALRNPRSCFYFAFLYLSYLCIGQKPGF